MTIHSLVVSKQACKLPFQCTFNDVRLSITIDKEVFKIKAPSLNVSNIKEFVMSGSGVRIRGQGITVESSNLDISGLDLDVLSKQNHNWIATIALDELTHQDTKVSDFQANVTISPHTLVISPVKKFLDQPAQMKVVSLGFRHKKEDYDIQFQQIRIERIDQIFSMGEGIGFMLKNARLQTSDLRIEGLDLNLQSKYLDQWDGLMIVKEFKKNNVQMTDIHTGVKINKQDIIFSEIQANLYKGKVTGELAVYLNPVFRYVSNITFNDIDTLLIEEVYPPFFSQVRDRLYGNGLIKGLTNDLETIQINLQLNEGGEVRAQLLSPLLSYIPRSQQYVVLEQAINENRRLVMDIATVALTSKGSDKLTALIILKSNELNLDMNLTIDFNIEGGFKALIENFDQLLTQ